MAYLRIARAEDYDRRAAMCKMRSIRCKSHRHRLVNVRNIEKRLDELTVGIRQQRLHRTNHRHIGLEIRIALSHLVEDSLQALDYPVMVLGGHGVDVDIDAAFVHWPKVLKPAKVSTPVHVIDWMPTICALLDIPEAEGAKWDGVNILSALKGEKNSALDNRELYCQGVHRRSAALRQGDFKLVVHRRKGDDKIELFDLSADPNEKKDISAKQPQRVAAMIKALAVQEKRDNDAVPTATN